MRTIKNERKREIILVEDNSAVISVITRALNSVNDKSYLVSFSDGEAVLKYLDAKTYVGSDAPDLILISLYCSGNNNEELIQILKSREKLKRIPVIALDNSPNLKNTRDIYDLRVNSYLIKPGDLVELYDYMYTTFSFWLNIVRLSTCPQMSANEINCETVHDKKYLEDTGFSGKADVLLVEDNPGDVRLTREALRDSGFKCNLHVFSNGADAIKFLNDKNNEQSGVLPSIILLDLNLPRMDGREVLAIIKASPEFRHIPVFILTTSANEKDIEQAYDLHANCYILKPLDMDQCISIFYCLKLFWFYKAVLP